MRRALSLILRVPVQLFYRRWTLGGDVPAQGQMTWKILAGFSGVLLLWTIIGDLRRPKHRDIPEAAIDEELDG